MQFTFAELNNQALVKMAPFAIDAYPKAGTARGSLAKLALGALGVVYGDIGTSPLYTMKTALGSVGIQDSHSSLAVIQALDGPIRFD
jgi:K+ potassium transporter